MLAAPKFVIAFLFLLSSVNGCSRQCDKANDNQLVFETEIKEKVDEKVWLFAVDGRKKPYNFLNDNGKLVGFDVDLISNVCKLASKNCKMVLAAFTECAFSSRDYNLPGRGLMAGWFDSCPSYTISADRKASFDFTDPYKETFSTFTVLPGNPSKFDPTLADFSNFTLTYLTGAVTNTRCLDRLGKTFGKIIIAKDLPDAKNILLTKQADALFSPRTKIADLEVLPNQFHCEIGGSGLMTKKGSAVSSWWNPAFRDYVASGQFHQFCVEAESLYQATFKCLTSPPSSVPSLDLQKHKQDDKTWLFAVSGRRKPFNFLDDQGQLVGFDIELIQSVCSVADKKCEVLLEEFTECSFTSRSINYPGRGLMANWFDACPGYVNSIDRKDTFDFTNAYLKSYSTFTVLPGNPSKFDPDNSDYSKFTFTYLTGAYTNAACLQRLKKTVKNVVIAENLPDAKRILNDREADVLFSPRSKIPDLETFPQRVHCELTGTSVMVKKGSTLVEWWNKAFETFTKQGGYQKLCQDSIKKYSFPIKCFPQEELNA